MSKAHEPAYPVPLGPGEALDDEMNPNGFTKREHFAAMAMQGLLASESRESLFDTTEGAARCAIEHADALLAELEKTS